jgi:hypothetical protein
MYQVVSTLFSASSVKCKVDFSDFWSEAKSGTTCSDVGTQSRTDVESLGSKPESS